MLIAIALVFAVAFTSSIARIVTLARTTIRRRGIGDD
jgi:hypothetical protein